MAAVMAEILERFDGLATELQADPQDVRRRIDAAIVEEYGQEWFDAHKASIEAEWSFAGQLLGFSFEAPPT